MQTITNTSLLFSLSSVRNEIARLQEQLQAAQAEETAIRSELHTRMQDEGAKTIEGHGLQLVRSSRKSVNVTDEEELRTFIAIQGRQDDYMKFDLVAAKKDGVKNGWPGVDEVVTDVLSVKEAKS